MRLTGVLADRDAWQATDCSIDKSHSVFGSRSALLILREAFYGTTKFDDFARRVGITPAVAATRLRELVDAGILEKQPYRAPGSRTRYDYRLTTRGRDLLPVLLAIQQWGDRHLQSERAPIEVVDQAGNPVRVAVISASGQVLDPNELTVRAAEW